MYHHTVIKRGAALLIGAVLLLGLFAVRMPVNAATEGINVGGKDTSLGTLSQKYETAGVTNPGFYTTVQGDPGGTSYGIYMFASRAGTPLDFAQWCQSQKIYQSIGNDLYRAYNYPSPGYGPNFNSTWESIGEQVPQLFAAAQHDYVEANIYQKLVDQLEANISGFRVDNYTNALKNVLWSRAVHHGASGAYSMIRRAFTDMGGFSGQSEAELIVAIYARSGLVLSRSDMESERGSSMSGYSPMSGVTAAKYGVSNMYMRYFFGSSPDVQLGVYYRLCVNEPSDALEMLYEIIEPQFHDGAYTLHMGENALNDKLLLDKDGSAWIFAYFEGGEYYTISTLEGKRLGAEKNGTVSVQAPDASDGQKWVWEQERGVWKNLRYGTYLVSSGNSVALSETPPEKGWTVKVKDGYFSAFGVVCPVKDVHKLVAGDCSFPIRGMLTSSSGLKNVHVAVVQNNTEKTGATIPGVYYAVSLNPADYSVTISRLTAGTYQFVITAQLGQSDDLYELIRTEFTVASGSGGEIITDDTFTVTFNANGGTFTEVPDTVKLNSKKTKGTMSVMLGDTYGPLPTVTKEGVDFSGWFMDDGTQVAPNSIAPAVNHTLTAQFGTLYTYSFLKEDGETVFKSGYLSDGQLVPNPGSITKAADSDYIYSFSHWLIKGTDTKYDPNRTAIDGADMVFVPVFNKTENTGTGGETGGETGGTSGTASGGYLTGLIPGTKVTNLTGYKVYREGTEVTDGLLATGMTAKNDKATVTVVVTGDVTGDGKITITDVVKLQSHVIGKDSLSGAYSKAGDINGDGKISITDVVQAAEVTVGKRTIG